MRTILFACLSFGVIALSGVPSAFAAKEVFQRTKPHLNIGTIGHIDDGRTGLTLALAAASQSSVDRESIQIDDPEGSGSIVVEALTAEILGSKYDWKVHDSNEADTLKNMVVEGSQNDVLLLVVAASGAGPTPQTREHILLARQTSVPAVAVFVNTDGASDSSQIEQTEKETRELLSEVGYDGDNAPIVFGSVEGALKGSRDGLLALADLVDGLEYAVDAPTAPIAQAQEASRFRAVLYVLAPEEGGQSGPLLGGYRPQFYFPTTDVSGQLDLSSAEGYLLPGEIGEVEVQAGHRFDPYKNFKFIVRIDSTTLAVGRITKILE